jgi:two-component system nitrogen regulation sensor histidine kinase NtrY
MASDATAIANGGERLAGRPEGRRLLALPGVVSVLLALFSAIGSFVILVGLTPIQPTASVTLALIILNAGFILLLTGLIIREIHRILTARRHGRAAARLHVRIVTLFSVAAGVPAIVVAIAAALTLNIGLDRWFSIRTKDIVSSSLSIAQAYVLENARNLQGTTLSMATDLDSARAVYSLDKAGFHDLITAQALGRALAHAALIDSSGAVVMQAETKADFEIPAPPKDAVSDAADGLPVLIEPRFRNIIGAIVKLKEVRDPTHELYLYTLRLVDPEVIRARQIVTTNATEYSGLEENRTTTQIAFALLYLGLTLVVVLSAIWTGIAVADRLVRPIRQLIGAAGEVSTGNLDVSVPVRASDGDVAQLGDTFNRMLQELKSQRNELIAVKDQIDDRRRFSEAVLAGVTAGVIGVDEDGVVTIVNRSAETMLALGPAAVGSRIGMLLPHVGRVFEVAKSSGRAVHREQVAFWRAGAERSFNIQVTLESGGDDSGEHAYVITIDDITDLVVAQRSTAWADVARRIAHEIKNPLTPIQLAAERIRRRYGKVITDDREVFDQCTDTIIRQVGDIGRMVDEFSSFARMPKPTLEKADLREPLKEAAFLVEVGRPDITFTRKFGDTPLIGHFDNRLLSQAFGNVIKNATEAIDGLDPDDRAGGEVRITAHGEGGNLIVEVADNGRGLPRENRHRLLEPYMTTRDKGTGLGLAIVKKIVEDHGGRLELHDAPADFHGGRGAMIRFVLPATPAEENEPAAVTTAAVQ